MQVLQEKKPAPESAAAGVFAVGASRDRLIERLHEPGEATESLPAIDESIGGAKQGLFLQAAANVINFAVHSRRKQSNPTRRNFFVRPCGGSGRIDPHHNMHMVAHHRIGIHPNGKDLSQFEQTLFNPLPPMLVGRSIVRIHPTQPRPSDASRDAVIEAGRVRIDEKAAGRGHVRSVTWSSQAVCRKSPTPFVIPCGNSGCPGSFVLSP
jgi:hypothetical protein